MAQSKESPAVQHNLKLNQTGLSRTNPHTNIHRLFLHVCSEIYIVKIIKCSCKKSLS